MFASSLRHSLLFLFLLAPPALAQAKVQQEEVSVRYGREALEQGDFTQAYQHFSYALSRSSAPLAEALWLLQTAARAEDADAQALWVHEVYAYGSNAKGRLGLKKNQAQWLPSEDPWPSQLAIARAQALQGVKKFRDRHAQGRRPAEPLLAEWAEDFGRMLALPVPSLRQLYAEDFSPQLRQDSSLQKDVVQNLERIIRQGFATSHPDLVIRAARSLRGLAAQARFKDLAGPPPLKLSQEEKTANAALARARKILVQDTPILTVEQLEDFEEDEQRLFTLQHASFAHPGLAVSPHHLYTIETSCGYWTLLGVASTVESHHQRLLQWYGDDPFQGRPGWMRIVPDSHGLEMEGAGYWWVGGFQGGDTTTLVCTLTSIPALGRGITHELTHRFDGAMFGGLPAWLAEGRAVWTASSYGKVEDMEFVDDHVNFGTMFGVAQKGYGGVDKLRDLINGEIEEYRDNYSAGYALFVYLRSWTGFEDEFPEPIFGQALQRFMQDRKRSKGGGLKGFEKYFVDGKDGRPEDFETFAADYHRFLQGFYWKDPKPWLERYDPRPPTGETAERVMDEPTATWLRRRAEPWFGQDQARVAGEVCVAAGLDKEALAAFRWSLAVDEPADAELEEFARLCAQQKAEDASWILQHWPRFSSPRRDFYGQGQAAPFLNQLPAVVEYLQQLEEAVLFYREQGLAATASALTADYNQIASYLGLEGIAPLPAVELQLHPFQHPPHHLGLSGWFEQGLTGHEDRRVEHLWFVDYQQDLHVGRDHARTGTDTMDRNAPMRDAFVVSREWQEPGQYRLRCKIEQTSSFFHGGVVIGWTRRDRNIRFDFLGGDAQYASGEEDSRAAANGFQWSLDGLYARQSARRGGVGFEREKTTWDLEIRVDGPTVEVWVDHRLEARLSTLDARPIQGYFGFYTSAGAMRVVSPQVQRFDRAQFVAAAGALGGGFHPRRKGASKLRELLDRPLTGLPLVGAGTAILWFPEESAEHLEKLEAGAWEAHIKENLDRFLEFWDVEDPSQGVLVVLPQGLPAAERKDLPSSYQEANEDFELPKGGLLWATHPPRPDLQEGRMTVGGWTRPLLLFADPAGIVRFARRISTSQPGLHRDLVRLLLEYQDHQRPGQAGADD